MASGSSEPLARWSRSRDGALLLGVCAGLGARLGADPRWLRVAFLIAALGSGVGVALYVVAALLLPAPDEDEAALGRRAAQRLRSLGEQLGDAGRDLLELVPRWIERRRDERLLVRVRALAGLAAFALGGLILLDSFDLLDWLSFWRVIGLMLCAVGLAFAFGGDARE